MSAEAALAIEVEQLAARQSFSAYLALVRVLKTISVSKQPQPLSLPQRRPGGRRAGDSIDCSGLRPDPEREQTVSAPHAGRAATGLVELQLARRDSSDAPPPPRSSAGGDFESVEELGRLVLVQQNQQGAYGAQNHRVAALQREGAKMRSRSWGSSSAKPEQQQQPTPVHGSNFTTGSSSSKRAGSNHTVPRLRLPAGEMAPQDVNSAARTRSSRRCAPQSPPVLKLFHLASDVLAAGAVLASRLSSHRSSESARTGTGRTLRSVRLHLDHDGIIDGVPALGTYRGATISAEAPVLSPSRSLALIASRAAAGFAVRRLAGMNYHTASVAAPAASPSHSDAVAQPDPDNVTAPRLHVVQLISSMRDALANGISSQAACEAARVPVNTLVHEMVYASVPLGSFERWTPAALDVCAYACEAAVKATAAGVSGVPQTFSARRCDEDAAREYLPGEAADNVAQVARRDTAISSPNLASRDQVLLRLAYMLKKILRCNELNTHAVNRWMLVLCGYLRRVREKQLAAAEQALETVVPALLSLLDRLMTGTVFDCKLHSVDTVHWLLASCDELLQVPAGRTGDHRQALVNRMLLDVRSFRWTYSYCCHVLAGGVPFGQVPRAAVERQVLRHLLICARRSIRGHKLSPQGPAHPLDNDTNEIRLLLNSTITANGSFAMFMQQMAPAIVDGNDAGGKLALQLVEQMCCLQDGGKIAMQSKDTVVVSPVLINIMLLAMSRIYFECNLGDDTCAARCCLAITVVLKLLQCDVSSVVEQACQLHLVEAALGEIVAEYEASERAIHLPKCIPGAVLTTDSFDSDYSSDLADSFSDTDEVEMMPKQLPHLSLGLPRVSSVPVVPKIQAACVQPSRDRIYANRNVHQLMLKLLISLLVTPDGNLCSRYWSATPLASGRPSMHRILYAHLENHQADAADLFNGFEGSVVQEAAICLLKLACKSMFDPTQYQHRERLASGTYATVYKCKQHNGKDCALKVIDRSSSAHHYCPLPDVFSEVRVLTRLRGCKGVCQMIDYGVGTDSFYIAMRCYTCSLRKWRNNLDQSYTPLFLRIFRNILDSLRLLASHSIVHLDLKCDNVLMSPLEGDDDDDNLARFWDPQKNGCLQYEVVLADFGVGEIARADDHKLRNRGTECIKSPEMLLADRCTDKAHPGYDRRRADASSAASDVWGAGCLLYELVMGEFLFDDNDFAHFFVRLTQPGPILTETQYTQLSNARIGTFLEHVMVRDISRRPSIEEVCRIFAREFDL